MPKREGPSSSKRKLLSAVAHSIMLYAAPVWQESLKHLKYRSMFLKIQRKLAIRICSAFRTVSTEAILVLAGIILIDLLVNERTATHGKEQAVKTTEKENTLSKWQRKWEATHHLGAWTKRLIPELKPWHKRGHGEITYALSQLLCGHGCFVAYFCRFKIKDSPKKQIFEYH
ncbi:uncharacterized protein LOC130898015 [Diorhabda carinulata]|uniref:uncharacterized protein LOC130898015 n=1 Tax=Diorhabda carinulata TaxID=1163345 RepID=UPI0025A2441C|nr:uncharacterized protein LOC130898015 [Diorhabda carinulata]